MGSTFRFQISVPSKIFSPSKTRRPGDDGYGRTGRGKKPLRTYMLERLVADGFGSKTRATSRYKITVFWYFVMLGFCISMSHLHLKKCTGPNVPKQQSPPQSVLLNKYSFFQEVGNKGYRLPNFLATAWSFVIVRRRC